MSLLLLLYYQPVRQEVILIINKCPRQVKTLKHLQQIKYHRQKYLKAYFMPSSKFYVKLRSFMFNRMNGTQNIILKVR